MSIDGLTPDVQFDLGYDLSFNRKSVDVGTVVSSSLTPDHRTEYDYDGLDRVVEIRRDAAPSGHEVAGVRIELDYDTGSGLVASIRRFDMTALFVIPDVETTYGYDDYLGKHVKSIVHTGRLVPPGSSPVATELANYAFTFDDQSRLVEFTNNIHPDESISAYTYDQRDQIVGADFDDASVTDEYYHYDINGNRVSTDETLGSEYTIDDHNRLEMDDVYRYEYDAEGNLEKRYPKNESGNWNRIEYTWDHRNRLTKVQEYVDNVLVKTVAHTYDAFNQWIRRTVDSEETFFVYDEGQIVLQFDGPSESDLSHRYLWGPAVDMLLADEEVSSLTSAGELYWPLGDHQGTIRDVAVTDSEGDVTVALHREYDAFGAITAASAPIDFLFAYTGRPLDSETGLQNNQHRWYDATVGRWISEDPIGFAAGDANLYRYVGNSPTNATDPTGLDELSDLEDFRENNPDHVYGREIDIVIELLRHQEQQREQALIAAQQKAQNRLDYLQAMLGQLIKFGDALASGELCGCNLPGEFNKNEWRVLRDHMQYARKYDNLKLVGLRDGSSMNLPLTPGFYLDQEAFYGGDETALTVLIHEPMHDLNRLGVGHEGNGLNDIIGPYSNDNMFSRFTFFLQRTRCGNRSLWQIARENARNAVKEPETEGPMP